MWAYICISCCIYVYSCLHLSACTSEYAWLCVRTFCLSALVLTLRPLSGGDVERVLPPTDRYSSNPGPPIINRPGRRVKALLGVSDGAIGSVAAALALTRAFANVMNTRTDLGSESSRLDTSTGQRGHSRCHRR